MSIIIYICLLCMFIQVCISLGVYIYICKQMTNKHNGSARENRPTKHPRSREGVERQGQPHNLLQRLPKWLQSPASERHKSSCNGLELEAIDGGRLESSDDADTP